jgi:hypothetical protein
MNGWEIFNFVLWERNAMGKKKGGDNDHKLTKQPYLLLLPRSLLFVAAHLLKH